MSFDVGAPVSHLGKAANFAWECEDVRLVVNHIGLPRIKDRIWEPWRHDLRELAAMPHIHCKVSGLLNEADKDWSVDAIAPYLLEVVDAFGFDRLIFGSDFPVQNSAGGFSTRLSTVLTILGDASKEDLRKLFRENARRVYRMSEERSPN